eukprot:403364483
MQKQLHIYPTLIVLSYLGTNLSIQSQLFNKQQREFVTKKVRYIFPNIQYTIDLDSPTFWDVKDSKILSIANHLCFKISNQSSIQLLVTTNFTNQEICQTNTSPQYIFQSLKNPDYSLKKITLYFSEIDANFELSSWGTNNFKRLNDFLLIPELTRYFQIVRSVFYKCNLVIDKGFFSRVLDVPQVKLISSTLDCKYLNKKLENIESLTQEEGSHLNQNMKKQFFSNVKRLILVNNVENSIHRKYPNIEYLYIDEQKREDGKILSIAPQNFTFKHLKEVYLDKRVTDTQIEFIVRKFYEES